MTREEMLNELYDIKNWKCDGDAKMHEVVTEAIKALEQESCDDAISRQAVRHILNYEVKLPIKVWKKVFELVDDLPSVTPQQKTGHWIWQTEDIYRCSECGEDIPVKEVMNVPQYEFCPDCGAKMTEVRDEK